MKIPFALGLAFLAGCAGRTPAPATASLQGAAILPVEAQPSGFAVRAPAEGAIGYSGSITPEGFAALQSADNASVHTLLIRSSRGSLETGIAMGEWVHARGLDVVVVDYCALSCANYVFTAAAHKTILPGAVVAWDGDAHGGGLRVALEKSHTPVSVEKIRAEEDALFARIGVSECVTRYGNEHQFNLGRAYTFRSQVHSFTLTPDDMQRFGVADVRAEAASKIDPRVAKWLDVSVSSVPTSVDARSACR